MMLRLQGKRLETHGNADRREKAKIATATNFQSTVEDSIKQFDNVLTEAGIKPTEETLTQKNEPTQKATTTTEEPSGQVQYVTRTINGKQVTKTLDEWLEAASKVEQADEYLQQAAQHLTKTRNTVTERQVQEEQHNSDEEDLALANAIQTGRPEEIVAALRKIREQAALNARKGIEQTSAAEKGKIIFNKVVAENPDIFNDPNLRQVAIAKDGELLKSGKIFDPVDQLNNFDLRFREAVKLTREWFSGVKSTTEADIKKQELIEKKKALLNVHSTNTKVTATGKDAANAPKSFASQEEYAQWLATQKRFRKSKAQLN